MAITEADIRHIIVRLQNKSFALGYMDAHTHIYTNTQIHTYTHTHTYITFWATEWGYSRSRTTPGYEKSLLDVEYIGRDLKRKLIQ